MFSIRWVVDINIFQGVCLGDQGGPAWQFQDVGGERRAVLAATIVGPIDGCATKGTGDLLLRTSKLVPWLINVMRGN